MSRGRGNAEVQHVGCMFIGSIGESKSMIIFCRAIFHLRKGGSIGLAQGLSKFSNILEWLEGDEQEEGYHSSSIHIHLSC